MSAPKMYYIPVEKETGKPYMSTYAKELILHTTKENAWYECDRLPSHEAVAIPAHEIDNLIKKYRK